MFGSLQMDEVADPIILAWQLGATNSADWGHIELLANYLVSNGRHAAGTLGGERRLLAGPWRRRSPA